MQGQFLFRIRQRDQGELETITSERQVDIPRNACRLLRGNRHHSTQGRTAKRAHMQQRLPNGTVIDGYRFAAVKLDKSSIMLDKGCFASASRSSANATSAHRQNASRPSNPQQVPWSVHRWPPCRARSQVRYRSREAERVRRASSLCTFRKARQVALMVLCCCQSTKPALWDMNSPPIGADELARA